MKLIHAMLAVAVTASTLSAQTAGRTASERYVGAAVSAHSTSNGAHADIRAAVSAIQSAGYLTVATDAVARASIDVLSTGKVSQAQWLAGSNSFASSIGVLSTQRVTRVWSADGTQFVETGVVWQASQVTNYTVALSSDFIDSGDGERPSWATNVFPFSDRDGIEYDGGSTTEELYILSRYVVRWSAPNLGSFPVMLVGVGEYAQGTAVVSQHISTVYSPVKAYAYQTDLTVVSNQTQAVKLDLTTHISTNAASVIAQAQPSTLMRYADFATTNTAGFAAFTNLNPAIYGMQVFQPTVGQSLAKARWDVASMPAGTLSVSAYASSAFSSNAVYAVLTLYTAGGAVVASNIGATVGISVLAVSNISATVTLSAPATNGYVVAEIFSAMAASNYVNVRSGGSYPFALSALNSPLGYLTLAQATALFALRDSGTQVNPTMAGSVKVQDAMTVGGLDYVPTIAGTTNALPADANKTNGVVYLVYP